MSSNANNPPAAVERGEALESAGSVALLFLCVAALYGHTLQVPFYLDDTRALIENFRLRDLSATFGNILSQRGLTSLTFAVNYRLTGWSLLPLHLTNIMLHAGCGILVWRLLRQLCGGKMLPLLGALLFLAHPLQTQAVTYVIQRATVLGAFFFLLAVFLYLRARGELMRGGVRSAPQYLFPYVLAVLSGACAVLAKENSVTLPLLLLVYDRLFPLPGQREWRRSLLDILPFCLVPLLFSVFILASFTGGDEGRIFSYPLASLRHNDPLHYLVTQFSVFWMYLRLLFLPYGQALEHNIPVVAELLTLQSVLSLAGLLAAFWYTWWLRKRLPLLTFAVVWFFLAILVESSVIPLDPLFEHRLYLPMFGFVLAVLSGVATLRRQRLVWVSLGMIVCVFGVIAWKRNALWSDPIALYEKNLRVAPDSERVCKALASLYERDGRYEDSFRLLERTIASYPNSYMLYGLLANHYAANGQGERALALLEKGMIERPGSNWLYEAAAVICKEYGRDMQRAIGYLRRGLFDEFSNKGRLLNTLGIYYSAAGATREAEQAFLDSLTYPAAEVDLANVYLNLAREYYYQERWRDCYATLKKVLDLSPGDPEALAQYVEMALRLGDRAGARQALDKLKWADPQAWSRLERLMYDGGGAVVQ